jgi:hypothetical protein
VPDLTDGAEEKNEIRSPATSRLSTGREAILTITISDWAIIVATALGPLAAVMISLWVERRRNRHSVRRTILQTLLNTQFSPDDPGYQMAIMGVAVEFRKDHEVMRAHRDFSNAANAGNDEAASIATRQKFISLVTLLFDRIGSKVSEDDVKGIAFVSVGYIQRSQLHLDTLKAVVRMADTLDAQLELLRNIPPGTDAKK